MILAAGEGRRLRGAWDAPKGLLEVGGETLVGRAVRLLRERGVADVVLVTGYQAPRYAALGGVRRVENARWAETGSAGSLDAGLAAVSGDVLVLESDLYYEPRALDVLLEARGGDLVLASGFTGAGDEVWVEGEAGRLVALGKDRRALRRVDGEFVGLCRFSAETAGLLRETYGRGRAALAYDTDVLAEVARVRPVALALVPDLAWGEIDDTSHLRRVRDEVWPRCALPEAGR